VSDAVRSGLLATQAFLEVRFGGSGGQGVILMGVILATAGARDHRYVIQTQSYGPEARGGYSRSDVIISDDPIDYPEVENAHLLVALSQDSAQAYAKMTRPGGILIYDSENVTELPPFAGTAYGLPFTRLAQEETGRVQTTNILALGAAVSLTGVVSVASLELAMRESVPPRTRELNTRALARGLAASADSWTKPRKGFS
jgi:2-oxoglutarate ferredoxin oxidoreductase subunit gamma